MLLGRTTFLQDVAEAVALLVGHSQNTHNEEKWLTPVVTVLGRWKQEEKKLKISLCYILNSRKIWATWDSVSKQLR